MWTTFLNGIWSWITNIIGAVIAALIQFIWAWVEVKVSEKWGELKAESDPFKRAYTLGLFRRRCSEEERRLKEDLSPAELKKLNDLIEQT